MESVIAKRAQGAANKEWMNKFMGRAWTSKIMNQGQFYGNTLSQIRAERSSAPALWYISTNLVPAL